MKYYCVLAEIYEGRYSGTKQAVIGKERKEKPKSWYSEKYGMTAFNIWLEKESEAEELCEMIRTGDVGIDSLLSLFKRKAA